MAESSSLESSESSVNAEAKTGSISSVVSIHIIGELQRIIEKNRQSK